METYFNFVSKKITKFIFTKYFFVLKKNITWQTVQCFIACLYGYIINKNVYLGFLWYFFLVVDKIFFKTYSYLKWVKKFPKIQFWSCICFCEIYLSICCSQGFRKMIGMTRFLIDASQLFAQILSYFTHFSLSLNLPLEEHTMIN